MAVVVAAADGVVHNGFANANFTPDVSAVLTGDLLIVTAETGENFGGDQIVTPTGFTVLQDEVFSGGLASIHSWTGWKVAEADAESVVVTFTSGHSIPFWGALIIVRGEFDPLDPIVYTRTEDTDGLATQAYVANDLVLAILHAARADNTINTTSQPSGFTEVIKERAATLNIVGALVDVAKLEASGSGSTSGLNYPWASKFSYDERTMVLLVAAAALAPVPENTTPPVVSGTTESGFTLTTDDGTWDGSPTGFSYEWQRSADGTTGWSTVGADQNTLVLDQGDAGYFFKCIVTASNGSGDGDPSESNVVGPTVAYPTIVRFTVSG